MKKLFESYTPPRDTDYFVHINKGNFWEVIALYNSLVHIDICFFLIKVEPDGLDTDQTSRLSGGSFVDMFQI